MDYKRIYDSFIVDRLNKQPNKPDYFERHHIMPRCMGGDNSKSNIIKLTPEDHYFAHLLLAKVYGGKLWLSLVVMSGRNKIVKDKNIAFRWNEFVKRKRFYFGLARRSADYSHEGLKGSDNGNHNDTLYEWFNLDTKQEEKSTLFDMHVKHGGNRGGWTSASSGDRNTYRGWTIKGRRVNRGMKGKSLSFVNRDGRTFFGTQSDFCKSFSISVASASRVCRHGDVTKCGWRLEGSKDRINGVTRDTGHYARKNTGKTYHIQKEDGEVIVGKRSEIAKHFNVSCALISAAFYSLEKGLCKAYKGYRLVKTEK